MIVFLFVLIDILIRNDVHRFVNAELRSLLLKLKIREILFYFLYNVQLIHDINPYVSS